MVFIIVLTKGVREELKNVIDKILSTTKIAQNESI